MSVPQPSLALQPGAERPHEGLPQRPSPKLALNAILQMSSRQICKNFQRGQCHWGDSCHRSHDVAQRRPMAQKGPSPTPVAGPSSAPPESAIAHPPSSPATIRIVDGVYTNRFGAKHASTTDTSHTHAQNGVNSGPQEETVKWPEPERREAQSAPSQAASEKIPAPSLPRLPARVAEEDTRPSKRTDEVCRLNQRGLCKYGERCHRAHVCEVPEQLAGWCSPNNEKTSKPQPSSSSGRPAIGRDGVEVCKLHFVGKCARGEACSYSHDIAPVPGPSSRPSEESQDQAVATPSEEIHVVDIPVRPLQHVVLPEGVCHKYHHKHFCNARPSTSTAPKSACPLSTEIALDNGAADDDAPRPSDRAKKRMKLRRKRAGDGPGEKDRGQGADADDVDSTVVWEEYATAARSSQRECEEKRNAVEVNGSRCAKKEKEMVGGVAAKGTGRGKKSNGEEAKIQVKEISGASRLEPENGQSSRPTEYVKDMDTDTEDATRSSAQESRVVSAETSLSPIASSSRMFEKDKPCFDFMYKGFCARSICRFSHENERLPGTTESVKNQNVQRKTDNNAWEEASRIPLPPHRPLGRRHAHSTRIQGAGNQVGVQSIASQGGVELPDVPLIPPGLGLETPDAQQSVPPEESMTITVLDSTKVTFKSGFGVDQVSTAFESRQILLSDLPTTVVPAELTKALEMFGEVNMVLPATPSSKATSAYRITFSHPDSAAEAAAALHGSLLFHVRVSARLVAQKSTGIGGGRLVDGDVLFELPTPATTAYVAYPTREEGEKAIALAEKKELRGMGVTGAFYQGIPSVGMHTVRFDFMPPDVTEKDLARYGQFESHMFSRPKYKSISSAIDGLKRMLAYHGTATINVLPPPRRQYLRVWAHFEDPGAAEEAAKRLHGFYPAFVGKQKIFAHHKKSLRYNLPAPIFDSLAEDINLYRCYLHDEEGTSISVIDRRSNGDPGAPVLVQLVSRSMASLTKGKIAFDQLLRGEKVKDNGQIVWNDFFGGHAGNKFLDDLEKCHARVRINRDPRRRTLALFGPGAGRASVRAAIIARAQQLRAQTKHHYSVAGNLMDALKNEDIMRLQNDIGSENVWFDLTKKELVVCGDEDVQKVARLAALHAGKRPARTSIGQLACPVCLGDITHPVTLSCGHTWCKACLTGFMNASVDSKTFPLTCLGDAGKCPHPIHLSIAQQLLSTDEFDAIVNASFLAYVQSRPDEFHYCPTPDCPQVYSKTTTRETILQCPSCLVRICAHCNTEYHETTSCQERNPHDEQLFDSWKMSHDVKDCPSCKVPIERTAGCNHMTCVSCKTHICWACLETFPTSQEVYDHMRSIHGGIGL